MDFWRKETSLSLGLSLQQGMIWSKSGEGQGLTMMRSNEVERGPIHQNKHWELIFFFGGGESTTQEKVQGLNESVDEKDPPFC